MKVLEVLGGGTWGGDSEVALAYISAMVERGDEVWVVCPDDDLECRFTKAGCNVVRSPDLIPFLQLLRLCRRERFDLVATHTSKAGFIGRLAAKVAGAPNIIHHAHGFAFRENQKRCMQRFYVLLERIAGRACDLILSVSEDHRQAALRERVAPAEKIVTVLNGVNPEAFGRNSKRDARQLLGIATDDVLIGVATRLAAKKGIDDLIAAFPAIHRDYPNARLVLVGDGPARAELEAQAKATGLGSRIHFTGFRRDIPSLLAAFDVMLQPSISEGLSLSVLEAMASAKPLVACDIPGNREILSHRVNGLLVPPSHPAALAAAVQWLLKHPSKAALMAAHAQADCRRRFSQDRMVRQTLESYDSVAERSVSSTVETECFQEG